MNQSSSSALLDTIRDQFNFGPYPHHPIEKTPVEDFNELYMHSMATPYYLRHQSLFNSENALILDAGCGTGFKALTLAYANPGARIVGIDISEKSVELARQRFAYHDYKNAEFHVLGIEDIGQLGMQFDYINCDEVLYLFPDPSAALTSFQRALKPHGFIRSNLHSLLQRSSFFRAQAMFQLLGLMDGNPEEFEIKMAVDILDAVKNDVDLKMRIPRISRRGEENVDKIKEEVLMNLLFQGDQGFTIPELFQFLRDSCLELVSMVNWRNWEVLDLFKSQDDMPALLALSLPEASPEDRLRLYELLHPQHRLLDFWCGHPIEVEGTLPPTTWTDADWQNATITLHPILCHPKLRGDWEKAAKADKPCLLNRYFDYTMSSERDWLIESTLASTLLPLIDGPQTLDALIDRYLKIRPVDPVTLQPIERKIVSERITQLLIHLEVATYVLVERGAAL
jgi:SAM-dependent methyltransferase